MYTEYSGGEYGRRLVGRESIGDENRLVKGMNGRWILRLEMGRKEWEEITGDGRNIG